MRAKVLAAGLTAVLSAIPVVAQQQPLPAFPSPQQSFPQPQQPAFPAPQPLIPQYPTTPGTPGLLPPLLPKPPLSPGAPATGLNTPQPGAPGMPKPPVAEFQLPFVEQKFAVSATDVTVKRVIGGWEVWAGQKLLRQTGENETNARDVARVFRELRPTEWVTIGGTKPVIEYGLTNGKPVVIGAQQVDPKDANANSNNATPVGFTQPQAPAFAGNVAKFVQPIDIKTARVEGIRGAWCVRDENSILLNFGTDKQGAEQTAAVIQKYGFNRVGIVGAANQPTMSYLFVSLEQAKPQPLPLNAQMDALTRTGIPVPGVGFVGEMVKIDSRKLEVRKDGTEWVVAFGPEVLGRFGPTEWTAREAARTLQDAKFTEYCKLGGTTNLTFFLVQGKAPVRAPFNAQGKTFDPAGLKVQQVNNKWLVTDAGRQLLEVGSAAEGETVVRVLKAYGFEQFAHLSGNGAKSGITYLVKTR